MKWFTNRTLEYRIQAKSCWHFWFAWRPVTVHTFPDGAEKKVWLETVLRKGKFHFLTWGPSWWDWEYKR